MYGRYGGEARHRINRWVADETEGKNVDPIAPGAIIACTRMVIANAVHFKGLWLRPFDERTTTQQPFYGLGGTDFPVEMMRQVKDFAFASGDGYQAVELPYDGGEMVVTVLLPADGSSRDFEVSFQGDSEVSF